MEPPSPQAADRDLLPFNDTKPVGAADFYFAINATFRFILNRFGPEGLRQYWTDLGNSYYAPVSELWRRMGISGIASYLRQAFDAEPGSSVTITEAENSVRLEVRQCPAIAHMQKHKRQIVPCFCQHCYYVNEAIASKAGFTVRVFGGNGSCHQVFSKASPSIPPQNLDAIKEAR